MKLHKRILKKKSGLTAQVEKLPSVPTIDGLDEDVLAHVNHFFETPLPRMEKFSLRTPEEANQALAMIEQTQVLLEQRMRAVRVLKTLCEQAKTSKPDA
jgi:hypothetical protein